MDLIVEYLNVEGFNGKGIAELVPDVPGFLASQGISGPYVGSQGDFSGNFDNTKVSKTINGNTKTGYVGMHNDTEITKLCFVDIDQANAYTAALMTQDPLARGKIGGLTGSGQPKRNLGSGNFNHNGVMAANILSLAQNGAPVQQWCTDAATVLSGTPYDQVFSLLPFQYALGNHLVHPLAPPLAGGGAPATGTLPPTPQTPPTAPPPAPTPKATPSADDPAEEPEEAEPFEEELTLPPSGDSSDKHISSLFKNEKPQYDVNNNPSRTLSKKVWKERRDSGKLMYPYPGPLYITFQPHPQDSILQPKFDVVADAADPNEFARVSTLSDIDEMMKLMDAPYMNTPYVTLKFQPNQESLIILHSTVVPDKTSQVYKLYDVGGKVYKPRKGDGISVEWDLDPINSTWSVTTVEIIGASRASTISIQNGMIEANAPDDVATMAKAGASPIVYSVNPWPAEMQALPAAQPTDFMGQSDNPASFQVQLSEPLMIMGIGDSLAGGLRGFPAPISYSSCNSDTAQLSENLQSYYRDGNRLLYLTNMMSSVSASPDVYAGVMMEEEGEPLDGDDLLVRPPVTADKVLWSKTGSEEGYATVSIKLLTPNATDLFSGRDSRKISPAVDETILLPNDLASIWPAQAPFNKKKLNECSILDRSKKNAYRQLTEILYSESGNKGASLDEEGNIISDAVELDATAPGVLECVFSDGSTWQIPNTDLDIGAIHDDHIFHGRVSGIHVYTQTSTHANAAHALLEADRRERMLNSDYNLTVSEEVDGERREKTVTDCLAFQQGEVYYILVGEELIVLNMGVEGIPVSLTPAQGLQLGGATPEQIQSTQEALEVSSKTEEPLLSDNATITQMDEAMTANNEEVATPSESTEEGGAEPPAMVQVEVDGEPEVVPESAVEAVAEEADEEAQEVLEEMTDEEIDADLHEEMSTPDYGFTEDEPIEVEGVEITEVKIEADLPTEASLDELDALLDGGADK